MKVILYMAMTANGYIAREDDYTSWSDEDWQSYKAIVSRYKNIIIGRKTYEIMLADKVFEELGDMTIVVISHSKISNVLTASNTQEALDILRAKNISAAIVAGGSQVNSLFAKDSLLDEIYLDIEPLVYGKGKPLFSIENFDFKLQLLDSKMLNNNTMQLHYKVLKNNEAQIA